jgi:hypothetical protein
MKKPRLSQFSLLFFAATPPFSKEKGLVLRPTETGAGLTQRLVSLYGLGDNASRIVLQAELLGVQRSQLRASAALNVWKNSYQANCRRALSTLRIQTSSSFTFEEAGHVGIFTRAVSIVDERHCAPYLSNAALLPLT